MGENVSTYRWTCPICSVTKPGLPTTDRVAVEEQAANALLSHVRTSVGDGHGDEGALPPGFDPDDATTHVSTDPAVDGAADADGPSTPR